MQQVQFRKNNPSVGTGTADTSLTPSAAIWDRCPWEQLRIGTVGGVVFHDDFESPPLIPTETTQIAYDKYKVYAVGTGTTVVPVKAINSVDLGRGIMSFVDAASGDNASLAQAMGALKISGDKTTSNKLWFECRLCKKSVLTNRQGWMVGLAEVDLWTLAAAVPYSSNAGAITNSAAFIGFEQLPADTTVAHTAYSDRATSFTEVGSNQITGLAAFTFTKLGFIYDPLNTTRAIRYFQDGVELTTATTLATITGTTNLKANSLGLILATVGGSAVSTDTIFLDWWRFAQLDPGVEYPGWIL